MKLKKIKKTKRPVVRPCPCVVNHTSCGYIVISHILGCPYNCSYCFLKTFYGKDEIVIYDNNDDIIRQVSDYMKQAERPLRISTGQYSDSLALDKQTGLSKLLIELFAGQEDHILELKTKSAEVDHLLDLDHKGKTVFGWSVNPEEICKREELGAESCELRIEAAKKCVASGYPVAFHFDPIFYYPGWEEDYNNVIGQIFEAIEPKNIAWISLGALRYKQERYSESVRVKIFSKMQELIRLHSKDVYIYLCMESDAVWQKSGISNLAGNCYQKNFKFFPKKPIDKT